MSDDDPHADEQARRVADVVTRARRAAERRGVVRGKKYDDER